MHGVVHFRRVGCMCASDCALLEMPDNMSNVNLE